MSAAYLVLDLQNDLVHVDGPNGKNALGEQVQSREIVRRTAKAIEKARAANVPVVFVRVGFSSDYRECSPVSPMFNAMKGYGLLKLGTWGTEIHPDVGMRETDFLVTKHRVSPFYGTNLEVILRSLGVTRLLMSGVSTAAVVQAGIREGHDRDYACTVIEDCCAAATVEEHQSSIAVLGRFAAIKTLDETVFG